MSKYYLLIHENENFYTPTQNTNIETREALRIILDTKQEQGVIEQVKQLELKNQQLKNE